MAEDKPKKTKDWAKTLVTMFAIGIISLIFANQYVADFPLTTKTFIFVIIAAIALYVGLKLLKFATPEKQLRVEDFIIFGTLIAGLVYVVIKFDIAPSFSIVAKNIASIVGLG